MRNARRTFSFWQFYKTILVQNVAMTVYITLMWKFSLRNVQNWRVFQTHHSLLIQNIWYIVQLTLNSLVYVSLSLYYFSLKHNENLEKIFVVYYIVFCCYNSSCFTDNCLSIFVKLLLLHKPTPEKMNSIVTRKDWDSVKVIR